MPTSDDPWANEKKHRQGLPHIWKLWGIVLCRICANTKETP